jgi:nucleotide-binding universal stress UspA family protein
VTGTSNSINPESVADPHRPVLVAIDFSEDSRAAVLWASAFAACAGGRLFVLHVVHDPADHPGYYRNNHDRTPQPMERVAEGMLEDFVVKLQREHPELSALATAERKLVSGLPPGRIVETAKRLDAKLIVLGSRGMTGLPHLMQGSVSERVVELARGPVVVVKAPGKGQAESKLRKAEEKRKKKEDKARRKQEKAALKSARSAPHSEPGPACGGD